MKRALILQHMDHDHPGRFADYFAEDGIGVDFVRLFEGQPIPKLGSYDLMMVLGGAQDTWQEDKFPWLAEEKAAIRTWVWDHAKPYFGICLGHQLLCDALGGEVGLAKGKEVGVFDVKLTEDGRTHPFFAGLSDSHSVMQWHHAEVQRAPQGAQILASSAISAAQAVAIDGHAIGTQFHCEFSPQTVLGWSSLPEYVAVLERELGPDAYSRLVRTCFPEMPGMARMTRQIWDNFKVSSGLLR